MLKKYTLSVTIITFNEADRLEACLKSVAALADEIIVVDSGSTDGTLDLARRYTDKVHSMDWPGYGKQKQRALDLATGDWVLAIDADEALDEELQGSVAQLLQQDRGNITGVRMPWAVTLYGKRLDHGRSARSPLRMVWRDGAYFTDAMVHEALVPAAGEMVTLKGRLLHYTHRDYYHGLQKSIDYAWLGSKKYFSQGRRCHSLWSASLRGVWTFIQIYFIRLGFLDGAVGYLMAMQYAHYNYHKYAGLWTLTRAEKLNKEGV